jgi:hypothetical protein
MNEKMERKKARDKRQEAKGRVIMAKAMNAWERWQKEVAKAMKA